jgi:hypothetical protein
MAKGTFRIAQGATAPSGVPDAALFFTLAVGLGRLGCRGLIGVVRSAHRRLFDPDDDGGLADGAVLANAALRQRDQTTAVATAFTLT